jgi:hypothetical protein
VCSREPSLAARMFSTQETVYVTFSAWFAIKYPGCSDTLGREDMMDAPVVFLSHREIILRSRPIVKSPLALALRLN